MYGGDAAYNSMTLELNASDSRGIDVSIDLSVDVLLSVAAIIISLFLFRSFAMKLKSLRERVSSLIPVSSSLFSTRPMP
jgi:hypothetical protein